MSSFYGNVGISSGSGGGSECNCPNIVIASYASSDDQCTLNKTWQEIYDADICFITSEGIQKNVNLVQQIFLDNEDGKYKIITNIKTIFVADATNDYPKQSNIK